MFAKAFKAFSLFFLSNLITLIISPSLLASDLPFPDMDYVYDTIMDKQQKGDPDAQNLSPYALERALEYFETHYGQHNRFLNKEIYFSLKRIVIVDMTQGRNKNRFKVINLQNATIASSKSMHGINSIANGNLQQQVPDTFSNFSGSLMTSNGFYILAERYTSRNKKVFGKARGPSKTNGVRLDGISPSTSNARTRGIVWHGSRKFSHPKEFKNDNPTVSEGCPSVPIAFFDKYHHTLEAGTLFYIYTNVESVKSNNAINDLQRTIAKPFR